ncbi:MAG: S-layer homology domain-containing protein [Chloroflexia bacterium]
MSSRYLSLLLLSTLGLFVSVGLTLANAAVGPGPAQQAGTPQPPVWDPDYGYKLGPELPADQTLSQHGPNHLIHPCGGMDPQPAFYGLSPLSIAYVPGMCSSGYGDIGVWQAAGHSYVVISGFNLRMFHIFNVDDPYNPVALVTQPFPAGGTAGTSAFPFQQGGNRYVSITMRGSGTGCGWFVYNVNNPASPQFVARKTGSDWCTVHEHFVSTDANGDADYAWLAMSGETGSGYKAVVLDIHDLSNITETGRYQRPDANSNIFVHDITVIGQLVFLAHWGGGVIVHDKQTLAHNINPTPLNPIDSIRPSSFNVHHMWPTSDGNHLFIEDEFINSAGLEKVKLYNIANLSAPYYETGIIGTDSAANSQAHNLKIQNIGPGLDRLYVGWYKAGTRGFEVDTTAVPPVITATIKHQLRATAGPGFGGTWGVDYLPCTVRGQPTTCIYSSDYQSFGLTVDALGYDPSRDPYPPESQITDPVNGQSITGCTYTIRGNAHDYYSGLAGVEVSTDNGVSWAPASGTTNWTYAWTIPGDGSYTLKSRALDAAGNVEVPTTTVTVSVSGCTVPTLTPTGTPAPSATAPPSPTSALSATATLTNTPTPTNMPSPTNTPIGPTDTPRPTNTPVGPTDTPQPTNTPSGPTDTPRATNTPGGPTDTPQPTDTPPPPSATPTACSINFSDVHPSDYFYTPVQYLFCHGVISGYSDGTYRPYSNTTRSQMVKIVVLGFDKAIVTPTGTAYTFTDVTRSNPYFSVVETAYADGIVSGYTCGVAPAGPCDAQHRPWFLPYAYVTRGQLSKIDVIAAQWALYTPTVPTFTDVTTANPFYTVIETAYCHGVISGYSDHTFRPYNNATRGQIAKIVYLSITNPPTSCGP